MDLLEDPETKKTYEKCKYIVKLWEHNFKKTHRRQPSKLDIRESDESVRHAYRKYFQLKTAALEQSFMDVEGFNSDEDELAKKQEETITETVSEIALGENNSNVAEKTWGRHLDNEIEVEEPKQQPKLNLNDTISKKLFLGSKFSKRNTRKSLSFTHKKSEASFESGFLSQPSFSCVSEESLDVEINPNVKIVAANREIASQPINIVQRMESNRNLKTVDKDWLERAQISSGFSLETIEKNYDSDDIIDESDDETSFNIMPATKRPKLDNSTNLTIENSSKTNDMSRTDFSNLFPKNCQKLDTFPNSNYYNNDEFPSTDSQKENILNLNNDTKSAEITIYENREETKPKKKIRTENRKSIRLSKKEMNLKDLSASEEDPFHSDNDSSDPEFNPSSAKPKKFDFAEIEEPKKEKSKTITKTNKVKTLKKSEKSAKTKLDTEDKTELPYELEYSIKPRIAAPRVKNIKRLIRDEKKCVKSDKPTKTTRNLLKEKLEKKMESGNLNENFVRIDLKKKIYCRGKKTMNFSKYKKQQWKAKKKALIGPNMDMGGCDGGFLTCFNCGELGHFARHCLKAKIDTLLPLVEDTDECTIPTLEEASKMAKDSCLAVRKPNLTAENEDSDCDLDVFNDSDTEVLLEETLKLEENVAKLDLQKYQDQTESVLPYYSVNVDGSLIQTPMEIYETLTEFGHTNFRHGQELAIMRILSGKSTLVTLSTGSGKSLCYQLPAYLYAKKQKCITLVISPLVSLMEDQVIGIPTFLKAACLHTNQTKVQREKIMENLGDLSVLLVSPETVVAGEKSSGFGSLLRKLPPIAFACIDEAHCVSQWSHNFRPSYLTLCRVLREKMGIKTILGLTATATRTTSDSIINHLQIPDGRNGIITDTPLPNNLILTISKDTERDRALLELISMELFEKCRSIIVYCTRREECVRIAGFLRTNLHYKKRNESIINNKKRKRIHVEAEAYHAGLAASKRRTIQKAFMSGELRIVVATVAFGMGINKADIRAVIHYNMPKSFESYVQEIGRAGRDGLPAYCHLFLDSRGKDENELRRHIHANSIDRHTVRKLLEKIFIPCSCKQNCPKHEVAFSIEETVKLLDIPEENISTLLCYLELNANKYVEVLSPAYTICKIISYGGNVEIRKAAKECPPLAMALALDENQKKNDNVFEFAVVDIASTIGWDSGICKHKLKNLEWTSVNGQPKRSKLTVQFHNLGFRLLAPGNLTDEQLDQALDGLYEHSVTQEKLALLQLRAVHETLVKCAKTTFKKSMVSDLNVELKEKIREYFESPYPLESVSLDDNNLVDEEQLINNIKSLIFMYKDNNFTGRSIARIFYGISSPNYPALIWGRCKFWRCQINVNFHTICKIATMEILKLRKHD